MQYKLLVLALVVACTSCSDDRPVAAPRNDGADSEDPGPQAPQFAEKIAVKNATADAIQEPAPSAAVLGTLPAGYEMVTVEPGDTLGEDEPVPSAYRNIPGAIAVTTLKGLTPAGRIRTQLVIRLQDGRLIRHAGLSSSSTSVAGASQPPRYVLVTLRPGDKIIEDKPIKSGPSTPLGAVARVRIELGSANSLAFQDCYRLANGTLVSPLVSSSSTASKGSAASAAPEIQKVAPDTVVTLPGKVNDLVVGGNGRYLLLIIRGLHKVAVFDVREGKVLKYVNVDDADCLVAGGQSRFVVADTTKHTLAAWHYDKLDQPESEVTYQTKSRTLVGIAVGFASEGPLLASFKYDGESNPNGSPLELFDLPSLSRAKATISFEVKLEAHQPTHIRALPNGSRFILAHETRDGRNQYCTLEVLKGSALVRSAAEYNTYENPGFAYDNRYVFSNATVHLLDQGLPVNVRMSGGELSHCWPSDYWMFGSQQSGNEERHVVNFHSGIDKIPFATFAVNYPSASRSTGVPRHVRQLDARGRTLYFGTEKTLVLLPIWATAIALKRLDLDELADRAGRVNLAIRSIPPIHFLRGTKFEYPIVATSNRGEVKFRLESGPKGMTVSSSGLVEWIPDGETSETQAAIVAISDASGKEILHSFRITARQPSAPTALAPSLPVQKPGTSKTTPKALSNTPEPSAPRPSIAVKLPAHAEDLCAGGNGRYLIAQLPRLRKAAVIDVREQKIARYLPIDDSDALITAGATKAVVALKTKKELIRYDLATGNRELSVPFVGGKIAALCMGSASEGPVLLGTAEDSDLIPQFFDLQTLRAANLEMPPFDGWGYGNVFCAGADGSLFGSWRPLVSPTGLHLLEVVDQKCRHYYEHASVGAVIPGPDGQVVYTNLGMFTNKAKRIGKPSSLSVRDQSFLPAVSGPLYMSVSLSPSPRGSSEKRLLRIHLQGESDSLFSVSDVQLPDGNKGESPLERQFEKRLYLIPSADALVTVPKNSDEVVIQRFNLDEELEKSKVDFLFAASVPPASVKAGTPLQYQIDAKSKRGGVKYRLESGPTGMTVSPTGLLSWKAVRGGETEEVVIVALGDSSGQEAFHTFKLKVDAGTTGPASGNSAVSTPKPTATPSGTAKAPTATLSGTATMPQVAGNLRKWTSSDGAFTVEAELVKVAGNTLTLRRTDGKSVDVPLDKLSAADQEFVSKNPPTK